MINTLLGITQSYSQSARNWFADSRCQEAAIFTLTELESWVTAPVAKDAVKELKARLVEVTGEDDPTIDLSLCPIMLAEVQKAWQPLVDASKQKHIASKPGLSMVKQAPDLKPSSSPSKENEENDGGTALSFSSPLRPAPQSQLGSGEMRVCRVPAYHHRLPPLASHPPPLKPTSKRTSKPTLICSVSSCAQMVNEITMTVQKTMQKLQAADNARYDGLRAEDHLLADGRATTALDAIQNVNVKVQKENVKQEAERVKQEAEREKQEAERGAAETARKETARYRKAERDATEQKRRVKEQERQAKEEERRAEYDRQTELEEEKQEARVEKEEKQQQAHAEREQKERCKHEETQRKLEEERPAQPALHPLHPLPPALCYLPAHPYTYALLSSEFCLRTGDQQDNLGRQLRRGRRRGGQASSRHRADPLAVLRGLEEASRGGAADASLRRAAHHLS